MRRFPSGVAVLTADADGDRIGLTVGSLVSLSLEPPLVGVSVGRSLAAHAIVRAAGSYAVSILGSEHEHLARRFASGMPPIALWEGVEVRRGGVAPLLEGALGWLECTLAAAHDVGDHTLFVGEVVSAEAGADGAALAYRSSTYHAVG
jgi:flavin reductase (DIM6/NTAB) family NADH-FMN oxidoreductase RutF